MWGFWILLCAAFCKESCASMADYVELLHGNQLNIKMPTTLSDSLEFTSVDESQHATLVSTFSFTKRGSLVGQGDSRRFIISSVNFDDEGTYTQKVFWSKVTHVTKVKVSPKKNTKDCVAGETLVIFLNGIKMNEASLRFSNQDVNVMLVQRGSAVANQPDFFQRIKVTRSSFEVLNVNVSDVGNYTLFDGKDREVVTTLLNLVDHHGGVNANPLMGLLLLLGIPAGICCCCRKKIFKKSGQSTAMTTVQTPMVPPPGPPPAYNNPMAPVGPSPMYTPGYTSVGESMVHPPPPDPAFPPQPQYTGQPAIPPNTQVTNGPVPPPSGFPPAQPPQWTGPPYNQPDPAMYTPGYPIPSDAALYPPHPNPAFPPQPQYSGQPAMPPNPAVGPMMYTAPVGAEGNKGDIRMNEISPAAPLLGPSHSEVGPHPTSYSGTDVLNSSNSAIQFNIDTGKNSTHNFL